MGRLRYSTWQVLSPRVWAVLATVWHYISDTLNLVNWRGRFYQRD